MPDVSRIATAIIAVVVVIIGGVVTITTPESLSFEDYIRSVSIGAGLLGIGYGIDPKSKP